MKKHERESPLITSVWQLVAQPQPLLTPNDIRDQTFTTHRFREGYDMDEVDDYLDQVRVTIETIGKAKLKEEK